jgi:hypothetical protein
VIKQNPQHFVRPNPEMRDHTQENQKSFEKKHVFEKFSLLELSGGQNIFCNYLTQESLVLFSFVNFFGRNPELGEA